MKYITIEELENRKKNLYERKKKLEEEAKSQNEKSGLNFSWADSQCINIDLIIAEINFLIDFCNMKQDTEQEDFFKVTFCTQCKKYNDCAVRKRAIFSGLAKCALYEEKERK